MSDDTEKRRQAVLVAFHAACPRPSAVEIADWIGRHPEWADDIRIHAEGALADPGDDAGSEEPSSGLLHRTRAMALATLKAARGEAATDATTFDRLLARVGLDLPMLANAVGLGRGPLVDLVHGRIDLPLPRKAAAALADALRTTIESFDEACRNGSPRLGRAKANGTPAARRRPFVDVVRDDPSTPPAQKAVWSERMEG